MARRKLGRVLDLEKGKKRLAAVKSIDPALDLGNGIEVPKYETEVTKMDTKLEAYNTSRCATHSLYNPSTVLNAVL